MSYSIFCLSFFKVRLREISFCSCCFKAIYSQQQHQHHGAHSSSSSRKEKLTDLLILLALNLNLTSRTTQRVHFSVDFLSCLWPCVTAEQHNSRKHYETMNIYYIYTQAAITVSMWSAALLHYVHMKSTQSRSGVRSREKPWCFR